MVMTRARAWPGMKGWREWKQRSLEAGGQGTERLRAEQVIPSMVKSPRRMPRVKMQREMGVQSSMHEGKWPENWQEEMREAQPSG